MDSFSQADCCELGGFGPGTRWMIERRGPAAVVPSALSCAIPSSTHLGFRESLQKEDTDLLHLFPPMGAALSLTWELCGLFPPLFLVIFMVTSLCDMVSWTFHHVKPGMLITWRFFIHFFFLHSSLHQKTKMLPDYFISNVLFTLAARRHKSRELSVTTGNIIAIFSHHL